MNNKLPTVAAPKGRLTEREARVVGATANRIVNLRGLLASQSGGGSLTVTTASGSVSLSIPQGDVEACLALLAERDAALLTLFDVELDAPLA